MSADNSPEHSGNSHSTPQGSAEILEDDFTSSEDSFLQSEPSGPPEVVVTDAPEDDWSGESDSDQRSQNSNDQLLFSDGYVRKVKEQLDLLLSRGQEAPSAILQELSELHEELSGPTKPVSKDLRARLDRALRGLSQDVPGAEASVISNTGDSSDMDVTGILPTVFSPPPKLKGPQHAPPPVATGSVQAVVQNTRETVQPAFRDVFHLQPDPKQKVPQGSGVKMVEKLEADIRQEREKKEREKKEKREGVLAVEREKWEGILAVEREKWEAKLEKLERKQAEEREKWEAELTQARAEIRQERAEMSQERAEMRQEREKRDAEIRQERAEMREDRLKWEVKLEKLEGKQAAEREKWEAYIGQERAEIKEDRKKLEVLLAQLKANEDSKVSESLGKAKALNLFGIRK